MADFRELQIKYLEDDAIINEYIENDEIDQLSEEFQLEYSKLRLEIIQAQSEINGVSYDFDTHRMDIDSSQVANTAIVKLLFSYYKIIDTLVVLDEVGSLLEAKEAIEDVIIEEFLSQQFTVNQLELA